MSTQSVSPQPNFHENRTNLFFRTAKNRGHWLMRLLLLSASTAILTLSMTLGHSAQVKNVAVENQSPEQLAQTLADYAYPFVIMKISRDLMLNSGLRQKTTDNHLILFKQLARPENTAVVLGNRDTLYTVDWIDLSKGPVAFSIPDMGDRYYVMPLLDAWTNTFKSLGSRTTGQDAQHYILYRKGDARPTVPGYEPIEAPTSMVWLTGRIEVQGDDDLSAAQDIQSQYKVITFAQALTGTDPFGDVEPKFIGADIGLPVPYSLKMSAEEYYNTFFEMLRINPPLDADQSFVEAVSKNLFDMGSVDAFSDIESSVQKLLGAGLKQQQDYLQATFTEGSAQETPWILNKQEMGTWGVDYSTRAYWAVWGLGANLVEDAVYGVTQLDADLQQLSGKNRYEMRFEAGDIPQVRGFWSLTAYDIEGYLEENQWKRYQVGQNYNIQTDDDGSLRIVLSSDKPGDINEENWLPIPKGDFKLLFRMYWPEPSVLAPSYELPPIARITK
jgi:hypothetical protein